MLHYFNKENIVPKPKSSLKPKLIYKISVLCIYPDDKELMSRFNIGPQEYYKGHFYIYKENKKYRVSCRIKNMTCDLNVYKKYCNAIKIVNKTMKKAMKGNLLYKKCLICETTNLFPALNCKECELELIQDWGYNV
tara:strand:+ start:519 stop:926 length:408 start_codon:yes stop_codon:yes gene_type:complete